MQPINRQQQIQQYLRNPCTGQLKYDGTCAETRFRLSAQRTSPFKSARASVHSTTSSRVVRISGSNAGYTMIRGSVKSTGYPFHSPVSPSFPRPCVTVCHHILNGLYLFLRISIIYVHDGKCLTTKPWGIVPCFVVPWSTKKL